MKNSKRSKIALVIGSIAVACLLLASMFVLLRTDDDGAEITGGILLSENPDMIIFRCLSPEVALSLHGFSGEVILTNCQLDARLKDYDDDISRDGTNFSFMAEKGRDIYELTTDEKSEFKFVVLGDSQGFNSMLEAILSNITDYEFVIHCGDMTPSGLPNEFDALEAAFDVSPIPIYTTPGNHDVKSDDGIEYRNRFAPMSYSFAYSGITFAIVDSSDLNISEEEIQWMKEIFKDAERKIVVTHAPSYDPFTDNHTLDLDSCERFQEFVLEEDVDTVFTGHVHAFHYQRIENTEFIITGGAGASLDNGTHHYVSVEVSPSSMSYEKTDIDFGQMGDFISITGKDGTVVNLTYEDLELMTQVHMYSSYENAYGNIGGQGDYTGILISDLLAHVGGMEEGDLLRIGSVDTYYQDFGYLNVYPDETWLELQGFMVVAMAYDDLYAPDWQDGPRLAMLPDDGLYSNSDCEMTSYEGQGYDINTSAGARWVRNVVNITILDGA